MKDIFQILIVTVNKKNIDFLKEMNIDKNAIICNQNGKTDTVIYGNNIKLFNYNDIGVGKNRNYGLINATANICLLADDDIYYFDNYEELIIDEFKKNKKADIIIFNLREEKPQRYVIKKSFRVNKLNYMRFGAVRIAFRTEKIKLNSIYFNEYFGGGCLYSHGEDTIFLKHCLENNLRIKAVPITIGFIKDDRESTWNNGINEKYITDQGKLYKCLSKKFWKFLCMQDIIRHRNQYNKVYKIKDAYTLMIKGGKEIEI